MSTAVLAGGVGASRRHHHHNRHASLLPLLLAAVLTAALLSSHSTAHASPQSLLEERRGLTYAYMMRRTLNNEGVPLEREVSVFPDNFDDSTDISVYTKDMHDAVVATLRAYKVTDLDIAPRGPLGSLLRAYLRASPVAECEKGKHALCCTMYWVTDSQEAFLPLSEVDPETVFWENMASVNGFYTNISDATVAPIDCSDTTVTKYEHRLGALLIGERGDWLWMDDAFITAYHLREMIVINGTTTINTGPQNYTSEFIAADEQLRAYAQGHFAATSRFGNIPLAAPIASCAGLLVALLIVLLVMLLWCEECTRRKELLALMERYQEQPEGFWHYESETSAAAASASAAASSLTMSRYTAAPLQQQKMSPWSFTGGSAGTDTDAVSKSSSPQQQQRPWPRTAPTKERPQSQRQAPHPQQQQSLRRTSSAMRSPQSTLKHVIPVVPAQWSSSPPTRSQSQRSFHQQNPYQQEQQQQPNRRSSMPAASSTPGVSTAAAQPAPSRSNSNGSLQRTRGSSGSLGSNNSIKNYTTNKNSSNSYQSPAAVSPPSSPVVSRVSQPLSMRQQPQPEPQQCACQSPPFQQQQQRQQQQCVRRPSIRWEEQPAPQQPQKQHQLSLSSAVSPACPPSISPPLLCRSGSGSSLRQPRHSSCGRLGPRRVSFVNLPSDEDGQCVGGGQEQQQQVLSTSRRSSFGTASSAASNIGGGYVNPLTQRRQ